jgi:hypothetical protein
VKRCRSVLSLTRACLHVICVNFSLRISPIPRSWRFPFSQPNQINPKMSIIITSSNRTLSFEASVPKLTPASSVVDHPKASFLPLEQK